MAEQIRGGERLLVSSGGTQGDMKLTDLVAYAKANLGGAVVANGGTVVVQNSALNDAHNATATVTGQMLTNVALAATTAIVDNNDVEVVTNSAGTTVTGTHNAIVTAGALASVKLASTVAPLVSGVKIVAPVTGTFVNGFTPTVVNGVITGVVLS